MKHTYDVVGMHCQSCVQKVTAALENVGGVTSANVTLKPPQATVEMDLHVPEESLSRSAQAAGGYSLREASIAEAQPTPSSALEEEARESLYPLFLIVAYIAGVTALVAIATGDQSPHTLMRHFMAGFFLVFSFFKLLDLRGFSDAYRSYDIVARTWPTWGFIYPFAELALGVAYLLNVAPFATNLVTLILMLAGAVGVLKALLDKRTIRCACLGTALNLPMTTITLVEDLGMAAMAAVMLIIL
jgi:copper chaperone CopZ